MASWKEKNRTIQEADRTMLNEAKLPDVYWRESIYTLVYILNRGKLRVNNDKTPYQLWYGRPSLVKYFILFGSKCYIKRNEDDISKFDSRTDEGIFLGYSSTKKAYRCFNKSLQNIVESENVRVDDLKPRKERRHDRVENTNNEEKEELQEDESTHDEEEGIEKEDTQ